MIGYHYRSKTYYILENVEMNRYCDLEECLIP